MKYWVIIFFSAGHFQVKNRDIYCVGRRGGVGH